MIKLLTLLALISSPVLHSAKKEAKVTELRFAVLAPEGSTWMNLMNKFNKDLEKASSEKIKFKIFPGGISGDEFDVIRKIRMNKIDSAGFTGVGLGQILPAVRVLELPRLFDSYEEIDYVTEKLTPYFEAEFEKKGYILLGWAEVGFVNIFSNEKVDSLKSLNGLKMWAWEGDPLASALFKALKISPNPMPITDVFTSLQTGLINAVYISPLASIAMQWHSKVKYMNTLKLTNATGAILISKKIFNKISSNEQKPLKTKAKDFCKQLIKASRKDNEEAYKILKKNKIKFVDLKKEDAKKFDEISQGVWKELVGKLYTQELLDKVLKYREEFRTKDEKKSKK